MPIMIHEERPKEVHYESYDWTSQWVCIHNMQPGMTTKMAVNALVSVLGTPLHFELVDKARHPQCLRACLQADPNFAYPPMIPFIIREEDRGITTSELQVTYKSKAPRCTLCQKFTHHTSNCPINHHQSTLPEQLVKISLVVIENMAKVSDNDSHVRQETHD